MATAVLFIFLLLFPYIFYSGLRKKYLILQTTLDDRTKLGLQGVLIWRSNDVRVGLVQRSTLAPSESLENSGIMYLLALLLPLLNAQNFDFQWRCTPSAVLRATELLLIQLSRFIRQARAYVRQLARDQIARDLFATAMDIVLVVYAIGFLFLSLYQASVFA